MDSFLRGAQGRAGFNGPRRPEQGATVAIHLATLPDDGPRGGFFDDEGVVPW